MRFQYVLLLARSSPPVLRIQRFLLLPRRWRLPLIWRSQGPFSVARLRGLLLLPRRRRLVILVRRFMRPPSWARKLFVLLAQVPRWTLRLLPHLLRILQRRRRANEEAPIYAHAPGSRRVREHSHLVDENCSQKDRSPKKKRRRQNAPRTSCRSPQKPTPRCSSCPSV